MVLFPNVVPVMQKLMRSDAGSEMNSLACMQLELGLHQDGFELLEKAKR
jgi:hypothetical protein